MTVSPTARLLLENVAGPHFSGLPAWFPLDVRSETATIHRHRRDCHFADAPFASLLTYLRKGDGGCSSKMRVSSTATGDHQVVERVLGPQRHGPRSDRPPVSVFHCLCTASTCSARGHEHLNRMPNSLVPCSTSKLSTLLVHERLQLAEFFGPRAAVRHNSSAASVGSFTVALSAWKGRN